MRQNSRAAEFLSEHGWLSFTPPEFRDKVLRRVVLHKFGKGQTVYRAGDEPGGLWAIVEGAVEISGASPGAVPHLIHFGVPGFWVGEAPLIYGIRRIVTVTVVRPSKLVRSPASMARSTCVVSRMRVSGRRNGTPPHRSTIVSLEAPMPSTNRPGASCATEPAPAAMTEGLRV